MTPQPGQVWRHKTRPMDIAILTYADETCVSFRVSRDRGSVHWGAQVFLECYEYLKTTSASKMLAGLWRLEDQLMDDNCGKGNLSRESIDAMDDLFNTYGECLMEDPDEA